MQLPERSTLAGGLSGLAAWGIGLALNHFGINISADVITGVVAILVPLVVHLVPDAAKVDAEIKVIATEMPQAYSSPTDYVNAPPQEIGSMTPNNLQ